MSCHLVGRGMASRTRSATQLTTQSFSVAHMTPVIRVYDEAGNVIATHEHAAQFKE